MRISDWSSDVCSSDLHLPRRADSRITDTRIELDALHRPDPAERPAPAGLLCTDLERRTLERADSARAHRLDVVRAHGAVSKPGRDDGTGVRHDSRRDPPVDSPGHRRPSHPPLPGAEGNV